MNFRSKENSKYLANQNTYLLIESKVMVNGYTYSQPYYNNAGELRMVNGGF